MMDMTIGKRIAALRKEKGLTQEELPAVRVLPPAERKDPKDMLLRIIVDSHEGDRVRVNLPIALVEVAMEIGMEMPQINGNDALKGVDLKKILELVRQGLVGNLVEVDSADGDKVRIFVE